MKISVGVLAMIIAMTGFCFGQQETRKKKAASNSEVIVEGHALPEKKTGITSGVKVEGFALHETQTNGKEAIEVVGYPITDQKTGKDPITIHRDRTLYFTNESKKSEVKITMTDDYNYLGISIRSEFNQGKIVVEIIDPKGEKQGSYTLKTEEQVVLGDNTKSTEDVSGEFDKYYKFPISGEWIIRAVPTAATGNIKLTLTQMYIKRTDTF